MSENDEIWYFVRGQESVGPFSKAMLRQIYEGGQLTPQTLVWKDGMETWKPAHSVSELEISSDPTQVPPPKNPEKTETTSPESKPQSKLKLKSPVQSPKKEPEPQLLPPLTAPAPKTSNLTPPSASKPPEPEPKKEEESSKPKLKDEGPSFLQKTISKVFSANFLTPLFLMGAAGTAFFFKTQFPTVLWFHWLLWSFGVFGILSFVGVRGLDSLFRALSFLFLIPPLGVLWPVVMGEASWKNISQAEWLFLGIGFLIFFTTRIGLAVYFSRTIGRFGGFLGIVALSLIGVIGTQKWQPQGWPELITKEIKPKLPAKLAKAIGMPELGTSQGWVVFFENNTPTEHQVESAILSRFSRDEGRLTIKTMDDILLIVKTKAEVNTLHPPGLLQSSCPIFFSKEAADQPGSVVSQWTISNQEKADIFSATLVPGRIDGNHWDGTLEIKLNGHDASITGKFQILVTEQDDGK